MKRHQRFRKYASRSSANGLRNGVSLIDVVLTVLIIGILAAVAAPRFASMLSQYRVEASANRLKADFEMAIRHARASSRPVTLTFDSAFAAYGSAEISDLNHGSAPYRVQLGEYPYSSTIVSADFDGNASVTFDRYGIPDNPGTVTIRSGNQNRTITIPVQGTPIGVSQ